MKKLLPLLFLTLSLFGQTNVQKDKDKKLSNGSIVVGDGTSLTATGSGVIAATSIPGLIISTTAPLAGGGSLASNLTISMPPATGSVNGYLTATDWAAFNAKQPAGSYITALTGDVLAAGPGSSAAILASVATAGTTGSSTAIPVITIDAKGRTTSISTAAVVAPAGTLTGTTLASNVVTSSLTSVGTIASGTWQGTPVANAYLANSTVTVGTTSIALGATSASLAGVTSITGATNLTIAAASGNIILTPSGTPGSGTEGFTNLGTGPVVSTQVFFPLRFGAGNKYALGSGFTTFDSVNDNIGKFAYNPLGTANDVQMGLQFESAFKNLPSYDSEIHFDWTSPDGNKSKRPLQFNIAWGPGYSTSDPVGKTNATFDVTSGTFGVGTGDSFIDNFKLDFTSSTHVMTWDGTAAIAGPLNVTDGTNGYLGLVQLAGAPSSPASGGIRAYSDSGGRLSFKNSSGNIASFGLSNISGTKVFEFPANAGTFIVADASTGITALTNAMTLNRNNIGVSSTDGLSLINATAATNGNQQMSPRLRLTGSGWKTASTAGSQAVDWAIENLPTQGTTSPGTDLLWSYQQNGGGFNTIMRLSDTRVGSNTTLWLRDLSSPSSSNYAIQSDGSTTNFNAPTTLNLRIANGTVASVSSTGLLANNTTDATASAAAFVSNGGITALKKIWAGTGGFVGTALAAPTSSDLTLTPGGNAFNVVVGNTANGSLLSLGVGPPYASGVSNSAQFIPMRYGPGNGFGFFGSWANFTSIQDNIGGFGYNQQATAGDVQWGTRFESRYLGSSEHYAYWVSPDGMTTVRPFQINVDWGPTYGGTTTGATITRFDGDEFNLYARGGSSSVFAAALSTSSGASTFRFDGTPQMLGAYLQGMTPPSSPADGNVLYSNVSSLLEWKNHSGFTTTFAAATSSHLFTFPNNDGTFAVMGGFANVGDFDATGAIVATSDLVTKGASTGVKFGSSSDTYLARSNVGDISLTNTGSTLSAFRITSSGSNQGAYLVFGPTGSGPATIQRSGSDVMTFSSSTATIVGNMTVSGTGTSSVAGDFSVATAGKTVTVKSGSNAAAGTVTLVAGAATITSTAIDANTVILFSEKTAGGTPGVYQPLAAVSSGSAAVTSAATDTSTYNWVALKVN